MKRTSDRIICVFRFALSCKEVSITITRVEKCYKLTRVIDTDVYEAADLDGATGFKRFSKITFPLLAPSFTINMVLSAKGYLMVYDQIMAMTDGGPGTATTSIAVLIYKRGFGGGQFAYQSANAVMLFIVVVLISIFQLRILEKREEKLG